MRRLRPIMEFARHYTATRQTQPASSAAASREFDKFVAARQRRIQPRQHCVSGVRRERHNPAKDAPAFLLIEFRGGLLQSLIDRSTWHHDFSSTRPLSVSSFFPLPFRPLIPFVGQGSTTSILLYRLLVLSPLNYGNGVLVGIPGYLLRRGYSRC